MKQLPQVFSQQDPRWSSILLGSSPTVTIGQDGCYITSFAMIADYYGKNITPIDVNNFFKTNALFASTDLVSNDNDLQQMFSDIPYQTTDHYESVPADLAKLQGYMQDNSLMVVLCIDLGGGSMHFVVAVDCDGTNVTIANPWTGHIEPFAQLYGDATKNILKFIVYKGTPAAQPIPVDPDTFSKLVHNSTQYDSVCDYFALARNSDFSAVKTKLDELNTKYLQAEKDIQTASQEAADMAKTYAAVKEDDSNLALRNFELGQENNTLTQTITAVAKEVGSDNTQQAIIDAIRSSKIQNVPIVKQYPSTLEIINEAIQNIWQVIKKKLKFA